jgi:hypothetical protein
MNSDCVYSMQAFFEMEHNRVGWSPGGDCNIWDDTVVRAFTSIINRRKERPHKVTLAHVDRVFRNNINRAFELDTISQAEEYRRTVEFRVQTKSFSRLHVSSQNTKAAGTRRQPS